LNYRFSKFLELIRFAELEDQLIGDGPFTVLAPTDSAFENLREEVADKIWSDKDAAALMVQHHLLADMVCCAGIPRQMPFFDLSHRRTMAGDVVSLQRSHGGHIYAGRAEVTTCDMVADNGVVHALDRVVVPRDLVEEPKIDEEGDVDYAAERSDSPFALFNLFK
jgi:transforming growth factor-beta-induced protein